MNTSRPLSRNASFLSPEVALLIVELMANISLNNYRLPSPEDFSGAIAALQRLQDTYELPTSALASGNVGSAPSLSMTGTCTGL